MDYSPILLKAPVKDYIWGGRRLIDDFGKESANKKAAESWELSTHPDGESIVISGCYKGKTLSEYISLNGKECIGQNAAKFDFFPILIKLIDAKDNLSIQVHPNDDYALSVEGEYGKTEMWYIVDCKPESYLYYGLNCSITKDELRFRIENNSLLDILNKVPVHKGDIFFIPSGTIHAICSGILICEIQQNSNTTYRLYDYGRTDKNGNKRELHIDKALDVANLSPNDKYIQKNSNILAKCRYFTSEKISCSDMIIIKSNPNSFQSIIILDGKGELSMNNNKIDIKKGDSIFIPAQNGCFTLSGKIDAILSYV